MTQTEDAFWRGSVFYQIYPRSFLDTNDDGIGDLAGITRKLDYVASLGVDGIWVSPFYRSPMRDFGYDVSDYRQVDPIFGTLEDFDTLLEQAHARNLKVIIDMVPSHTSDDHDWFQKSRSSRDGAFADWYVWANAKPDGAPPNNWQSVFSGPAWTWDAGRRQYYLHNFLGCQPALNVHNPAVQDALMDICAFWLDRGVDGFRLDAINHAMCDPQLRDNPPRIAQPRPDQFPRTYDFQKSVHNISQPEMLGFIARLRALANSYGPRYLVAEIGGSEPFDDMVSYTQGPARLHTAYSFELLETDELTPASIRKIESPWLDDCAAESWPAWALSNHDRPRAVSRFGATPASREAMAKMLLTLLMSLRGSVFLYQGEELGLPQGNVPYERLTDPEAIANWPETLGRDGTRTPMPWSDTDAQAGFSGAEPWLPVDEAHRSLAVTIQEGAPGSALNFTRDLLRFRRSQPDIKTAPMTFLETADPILAFRRGALSCYFNLSNRMISWDPAGHDILFRIDTSSPSDTLGPYDAVITRKT